MSVGTAQVDPVEVTGGDVIELHDGTTVRVHPMDASDAPSLERFHHMLSAETRYFRFFTFHPWLSEEELHHFTHVDHTMREAIVAAAGDEIVAVARFDRRKGLLEAEVAFVVVDGWQGLGLGTALFRRLADRARAVGVRRLVADVLPHNRRMLAVFHHSGLSVHSETRDGVVHLVLDL